MADTTVEKKRTPGLRERLGDWVSGNGHRVSELIGRTTLSTGSASLYRSKAQVRTVDETIPDYQFYDRLRRGQAKGYSLGSLFARRVENVFSSWVFGNGIRVMLKDTPMEEDEDSAVSYTNELLDWFIDELIDVPDADGDEDVEGALMFRLYEDHMGLGDQYIVVNVDGSLSIPSPDTVEVEWNKYDYRMIDRFTITTKLKEATITDEYTATERTVTVKEKNPDREMTTVYPNLIGRIPVVHLAHDRGANETNGRSIHEALRPLYSQYDDVIYKQLDGAKLLGNPIPTITGLLDLDAAINANDPATQDTYTDKDGATATRTQLNIDQNAVMLIGEGGDFKFVGPTVGFTEDTKQTLKGLFLLLLDHTGIPEFVWGNQLTSSRATAEVQMEQWTRDVQGRQKKASGWLLKLCKLWLMVQALTDTRVVVDKLMAKWPPLIGEDRAMLLQVVQFAKYAGLITDKTALELLHLVKNPEVEVEAARQQISDAMAAEYPDGYTGLFRQRLQEGQTGGEGSDEGGEE